MGSEQLDSIFDLLAILDPKVHTPTPPEHFPSRPCFSPGRKNRRRLLRKDVLRASVLGFTLLAYGTLGFRVIEGASLLDSLYMTVITVTTVGFQEVIPTSTGGKFLIFSIINYPGFIFSI